jgi:hypothetical protein
LTYLDCKIENIINNNTAQCDCEKQIKNNPGNNTSNPLQKTTAKEKTTEEVFTIITEKKLYAWVKQLVLPTASTTTPLLLTGFDKTIFQPPKL